MGGLIAKESYKNAFAEMQDKEEFYATNNLIQFVPIFKKLNIRDADVIQLFSVFQQIDLDNSGSLSVDEFFNYFEIGWVTPMSRRIFTLFDADNSGELDFGEFTACAWNYLSLTDNGILYFIFDLYDEDESTRLTYEEFKKMMLEAYGKRKRMAANVVATMKRVELANMEEFMEWTTQEFVTFVNKQRSSFWPLFTMQTEMRHKIVGLNFWLNVVKRRAAAFDPTVGGGLVRTSVFDFGFGLDPGFGLGFDIVFGFGFGFGFVFDFVFGFLVALILVCAWSVYLELAYASGLTFCIHGLPLFPFGFNLPGQAQCGGLHERTRLRHRRGPEHSAGQEEAAGMTHDMPSTT